MKRVKVLTDIDEQNMKNKGTQFAKPVKMRESTYNILTDMKKNDKKMKSIDDVIVSLITIVAMGSEE